jgi:putative oxidoreductase
MQPNWFARVAYLLLRLVAGLIMLQSGGTKLFGWLGGMPADQPPLHLMSQVGIGAVIELVGGLLMMLGLFVRPTAFLLSGLMAVAYWQFHYGWGSGKGWTWPSQNGGIPAVMLCFVFLLFAAHGAGMMSVDETRSVKKKSSKGG